ncbi:MAG TPA: hypothetical protein VFL58_02965 [Gaiellaceae bacterium]|nr:hypothetical protein [Gaiellaceae bacterium]
MPQDRRGGLAGYARVDEHRYREVLDQQDVGRRSGFKLKVELAPVSLTHPPFVQQILDAFDATIEMPGTVGQVHTNEPIAPGARRHPRPVARDLSALPDFLGS